MFGVYLFKDDVGYVIYIGKVMNFCFWVSSYFFKGVEEELCMVIWVNEICDVDCIECDSEVDVVLMEVWLIKDI